MSNASKPQTADETSVQNNQNELPRGVGLAFRPQFLGLLESHPNLADYIEIPVNMYAMPQQRNVCDPDWSSIKKLSSQFPLIAHGPCFSLGSGVDHDDIELVSTETILSQFNIKTFSEHLCFYKGKKSQSFSFLALPFTEEVADFVANKIAYLQYKLNKPLLVENITQHFTFKESSLTEAEFISRVVEKANCGIMLDVANLFINSVNSHFDPFQFIDQLPADRIWQCHFCGAGVTRDNYLVDDHCEPTFEDIWTILDYALKNTALQAVTLERDSRFEYKMEVIDELWTAQEYWQKYQAKEKIVIQTPFSKPKGPLSYPELENFQDAVLDSLNSPIEQNLADTLTQQAELNDLSDSFTKLLLSVEERGFRIAQQGIQSEPAPLPFEKLTRDMLPA